MSAMTERLAQFFDAAIQQSFDGSDFDGGAIQDLAESLGLIVETIYDPDKHGENDVGAEAGDAWFVISPDVLRAIKGAKS